MAGAVDQSAKGRRHHHAGHAAQGHDGPNRAARPMMRKQKDTQKWANAGLHVRHKEVERFKRRPNPQGQPSILHHAIPEQPINKRRTACCPSSRTGKGIEP